MDEIGKAILEAGLELGHSKTDVVLQESQIPATAFRVALRQEGDVIVTIAPRVLTPSGVKCSSP